MANYTTPGVYVEEISTIPPSVAPVATAIPAFIGYTEKAFEKESLHLKPFRISSMLDYESYFGYAYPQKGIEVTVDGSTITKIEGLNNTPAFKMYYALQMYFANGGGPCYIVSIGQYGIPNPPPPGPVLPPNITLTDHEKGLAAVEKEDEPTLLIFPDSNGLNSANDYYSVMNQGLIQSNKLQDRFTIIDTYKDGAIGTSDNPIPELRNNITNDTDYRKYGAAYYPYLKTIIDYNYNDAEVDVTLNNLNFTSRIDEKLIVIDEINTKLSGLATPINDYYTNVLPTTPTSNPLDEDDRLIGRGYIQNLINIFTQYADTFNSMIAVYEELNILLDGTLQSEIDDLITWTENNINQKLNDFNGFYTEFGAATLEEIRAKAIFTSILSVSMLDYVSGNFDFIGKVTSLYLSPTGYISVLNDTIITDGYDTSVATTLEAVKQVNNLLYNQIKQTIADVPMLLPPSSAIAGVYARVDNSLGVWRAPANVSLTYVIAPSQIVSNEDQGGMNVDDVSGKSINAIRAFTGKGTMVWGARTLDGNSNEWRFINVRRFYNFAEESVKKATEPFVFQSNDANTWVMVRGMIESFLTQQWKAGALAGASTEQAFYVKIGLGSTMTTQDILEGRMIVEIGMAVVRPAEFIILRFTHKMQEL